jgi:hypothetical protein
VILALRFDERRALKVAAHIARVALAHRRQD